MEAIKVNPNQKELTPKQKVVAQKILKAIQKTETTPNVEDWSKDVESTAKALEGVDSNFTADLSDSKLSISLFNLSEMFFIFPFTIGSFSFLSFGFCWS